MLDQSANPMLVYIESALDSGLLLARASNGNMLKCRRNGKTQTWKTRPGEFRIPIKAGFRTCGEVTHTSSIGQCGDGTGCDFMVDGPEYSVSISLARGEYNAA